MDGVQADFFDSWSRFAGVDSYKDIEDPEESIKELASQGPEKVYRFFRDLPTLRGGLRVIDWLQEHDIPYTILSAPLRYEHQASIMGKKEWLDQHHVGASESAIFASDKSKYATDSEGRPNVLIDDFGKNTIPWNDKGGIGIKHDPFDEGPTIKALEDIYLDKDDIDEASPNTLQGSFTPDLQYSKVWLLDEVQKILEKAQLKKLKCSASNPDLAAASIANCGRVTIIRETKSLTEWVGRATRAARARAGPRPARGAPRRPTCETTASGAGSLRRRG